MASCRDSRHSGLHPYDALARRAGTGGGRTRTGTQGRPVQYLNMTYSAHETWEQALHLLRSPMQRTVWISTQIRTELPVRVAGLSALARLSMLTEPRSPVFAVSRTAWQALKADIVELPEAMPGACEWQLWNYTPTLQPDSDTVDPLSLILSLRDSTDERVQSALEALKEQLPW